MFCCWLVVVVCCSLVVRRLLFVVCCWLLVVGCFCCRLSVVESWLWFAFVRCVLFVMCGLLVYRFFCLVVG